MKIELMDINYFIEKKKIKEVKSAKIEGRGGKLDSEGLFSEEIFGRVGSPIRKLTFGYIDLHVKIIHPQCWDMIVGLNPMINKMLTGKKKYIINPDGDIEESTDSFIGMSGIKALIDNWDKLNLNLVGKKHPEYVKFLKNNKEKIFIDKILVIPAGIRDVQLNVGGTNKKIITSSEVNTLYEELLQQTKTVDSNLLDFLDDETVKNIVGAIQRKVIEINKWIEERLKGKNGILRGGLLSKTVDYSGRFNIVNDMSVKQGYIGVPWQAVLKLYEPFTIYHIIKNKYNVNVKELIKQQLNIENELSSSDLKRFLTLINEQPNIVSKELEDELVRIAEEITKDKMILYKRDPVENRNSYIAGYIRVDRNSLVIKLNPLDCPRQGADFDGDSINARINLLFLNGGIKNIHISEFKDVCNCEKINTHTNKNGATVTDYNVLDEVYIDAIDINTGDIQKKKITNWSIHEHLKIWDIKKHNRNSLIPAIGEFKVSEDHSLIVLDMENESIKRTNIKDVIENKNKYAFIRTTNLIKKPDQETIFDMNSNYNSSEFGYFCGSWMGDGSISTSEPPKYNRQIMFANSNQKILDKYRSTLEFTLQNVVNKLKYSIRSYPAKKRPLSGNNYSDIEVPQIRVTNKDLHTLLYENFASVKYTNKRSVNSETKYIPQEYGFYEKFFIAFMAGYLDTDGTINKKNCTFTSKSKTLLDNLAQILKSIYKCNASVMNVGRMKGDKYVDYWLLSLSITNNQDLFTQIIEHMACDEKKNKIVEILEGYQNYKKRYITYIPRSLVKQSNNLNLTADEKAAIRNNKFTQSRIIVSDEDINKVQNESIRNILRLQNNQEIQILPCIYFDYEFDSNTTTAYDLTVEDYKTFTTEDGIFVYDTEALYPLFTKKANEEAKLYMNPRTSKSAWLSPENMTKSVYDLKLDAIATVYTVTKF